MCNLKIMPGISRLIIYPPSYHCELLNVCCYIAVCCLCKLLFEGYCNTKCRGAVNNKLIGGGGRGAGVNIGWGVRN